MTDRYTRANPEAEKAVIACLLKSPDASRAAISRLDPNDLTDETARAIVACYQEDGVVDEVYLATRAASEVGGDVSQVVAYMQATRRSPANSHNIAEYVGLVQDAARERRAVRTMNDGITRILAGENGADVLHDVVRRLKDDSPPGQDGSLADVITAYHETVVQYHEHPLADGEVRGLSTGLTKLDALTGGLETAFYVSAARPSIGKTALWSQVAVNVARQVRDDPDDDRVVLYFTAEMTAEQLIERLTCALSEVRRDSVRKGHLDADQMARYLGVLGDLYELPLEIIYTNRLREVVARAYQEPAPVMIVVDYLNKMQGGQGENRNQRFGDITNTLFDLSIELGIPVVLLAQLNRAVEHRGSESLPVLADLRDSGEIEQTVDVVLMLHRYVDDSVEHWNPRSLIVLKRKDRLGGGQGERDTLYFGVHGEVKDDRHRRGYETEYTGE
jgi:replicative DNA helicase